MRCQLLPGDLVILEGMCGFWSDIEEYEGHVAMTGAIKKMVDFHHMTITVIAVKSRPSLDRWALRDRCNACLVMSTYGLAWTWVETQLMNPTLGNGQAVRT